MADGSVKIDITADDSDIKKKLNGVGDEAEDAADKLDDLGDSAGKSGKGFGIADVAIGNFVSNGVTALVSKVGEAISSLIALADETREYREDMAKLQTAFKNTGHSTETAQKAYDGFYKLLGESDRSVEAVNHLAELTDNTEEVVKWTNIAAGVTAKFGDSLPIEGLTEAANETAKVGAVTGPLADALNWAGISEDEFNKKLAACNSEQERATLITNTLSAEYEAAAAEYNTLTASTQAARDATNRMEQSQAALGAAIEPVTTAITNMKATALGWLAEGLTPLITNTAEAERTTKGLTESQWASITAARETAAAYRETKTAAMELALAQISDVDYATNYLIPQLQQLVDANGRVKQGYEERAAFIIGQLNEAYGTEYTRISEIIGANGQLKQSIVETIEAKKAQILLQPHEEAYKKAVQNVAEAEKTRAQQAQWLADQNEVIKKSEEAVKKARDEVAAAGINTDRATMQSLGQKVKDAEDKLAIEKGILKDLEKEYNKSNDDLQGYYKDISAYQTASTLLMEGKTGEALSYLNDLSAGYETTTGNVQNATEKQRKALEQQVIDTEVNARLMKEAYESGVAGVTEEMVKTAEAQAATAKEKFHEVGGDITKGIAEGAEGQEWTLSGAMTRLINKALAAAKKAADSHSPSRLFRDEIGKMIGAGIAVGIEQSAKSVVSAEEKLFDKLKSVLEDAEAENIETVKGFMNERKQIDKKYNDDLWESNYQHSLELQKLTEDKEEKLTEAKKKKGEERNKAIAEINKDFAEQEATLVDKHNKELIALEENYNKDIQAVFGKTQDLIRSKMTALVTLNEDYKNNVEQTQKELNDNIAELWKNYDNQLASRTESIANSLNLWQHAEKNAVSGKDLTRNLISQINVLEDYNEAIATLEGRGISGAFLEELKGLGVAAAGEIEALSKMSDDALKQYVELWGEKQELAKTAAIEELEPLKDETLLKITELTEGASTKLTELRTEYQEQSLQLMADLKQSMIDTGDAGYNELILQVDDYMGAGSDLMGGVIEGILNKAPEVINAVSSAVRGAIDAAKAAAGIASPSKVMEQEVGANLAEGVAVGWTNKIDRLRGKMAAEMQGITARIQATVNAENARMAQGVGVRDTGFAEVAQAVGMQTAGINSLASEYRRGSSAQVIVPLIVDGRELGRAIVDLGNAETARTGTSLVTA